MKKGHSRAENWRRVARIRGTGLAGIELTRGLWNPSLETRLKKCALRGTLEGEADPMTLTRITHKAGHQPARKHGDAWLCLRCGSLCLAFDPPGLRAPQKKQDPRRRPESCQVISPFSRPRRYFPRHCRISTKGKHEG